MYSLQNLINLNENEFASSLSDDVNIRSLIENESSIYLLKRFAKRLSLLPSSSQFTEFSLRRIFEIDAQDLSVLVALAWELWAFGEDEEARSFAHRARTIAPDNKWVLHLSVALSKDIPEKISILDRFLQQEPENNRIKMNLDQLKLGQSNVVLEFSPDELLD
jgi:hypothetical protein